MFAGMLASAVFAEVDPRRDGPHKGHHPDGPSPHGPRVQDMFRKMDKNRDGGISKEEFFAFGRMDRIPVEKQEKFFDRLDSDGNGSLTEEEIRGMRKNREEDRKREFRELDANKSGGLDFAEFSQGKFFQKLPEEKRRQIFDRMDTDGDGEVTPKDKPKGPPKGPPRGRDRDRVDKKDGKDGKAGERVSRDVNGSEARGTMRLPEVRSLQFRPMESPRLHAGDVTMEQRASCR